ncbi:MAG TPA: thioesterase family protein [Thermoanaerobaculia bacterium]|nr:thioesterase family protein [Thermoanaerobaculia bacterium]
MAEPTRCTTEVEVRYAETDQMGVVHHANYVVWFELARTRLCAMSGYRYADIERLGYQLMVTAVEIRYRRPARYGDTVGVVCWGERLASRGVRFAYEVLRGADLLATGATEHVWVETATGRFCRTPAPLRAPFERLAGIDDTSNSGAGGVQQAGSGTGSAGPRVKERDR